MAQYKRIVLLRFPPTTERDEIADIFEMVDELPGKVPGVVDVCGGPYNSPEGLNKGLTHAILLTFDNEQARDAALEHPEFERVNKRILAQLAGGLADLITFDFKDCVRFRY